jgi:hypothetical protein
MWRSGDKESGIVGARMTAGGWSDRPAIAGIPAMERQRPDASWKQIARLLGLAFVLVAAAAGLNYVVDPLQLFHKPWFYRGAYTYESRIQNAGLIEQQNFDTVYMGTSLAVHFRKSEIDQALNVNSVKLALAGSTSREQVFVLDQAIKKRPGTVIWQMDEWIFRNAAPPGDTIQTGLYSKSFSGIGGYLLGLSTTKESVGVVLRLVPPLQKLVHGLAAIQIIKFYVQDVDDIGTLPDNQRSVYNKDSALRSFDHYRRHPAEISAGYDLPSMKRNFESDAIGLIRNHPDVRFRIYFPPYSILQFVAMRDYAPDTLDVVLEFSAYATQRLLEFPNVSVADFRHVSGITHNLDNYLDLAHHSPDVDRAVLQFLATAAHEVERAAPARPTAELARQVAAYPSQATGVARKQDRDR